MDTEKLWRVWWVWGIALAAALAGLIWVAETARDAGYERWGDALDVARLPLYWIWMLRVWRCAANVVNPIWTPLARAAAVVGLVANALA